MTPDELREAGEKLYGYGWQTKMAAAIRANPSTVRRWVSGAVTIPGSVEAWLKCELKRLEEG